MSLQRTPTFASPKKSLTSASEVGLGMRMKIVQGFRAGRLVVGVLAPVLSVAGDIIPSSPFDSAFKGADVDTSGVALPDLEGGLLRSTSGLAPGAGDVAPSFAEAAAASRSALSCCLRSFLRSRFARSFSALSAAAWVCAPPFSLGVSRPVVGGGVEGFDLEPVRWGGSGFSAATGVAAVPVPVPFGVAAVPGPVGCPELADRGVAAMVDGVTVRR